MTLYAQWEKENVSVESVSLDKTEATLKEGIQRTDEVVVRQV